VPSVEQGLARLEVRAEQCERRLLRLEDQEVRGKLSVRSEKIDTLAHEIGEVHADQIWMKRAFVGAILSLLGAMLLFLVTTQLGAL
jgi:hypothetical protein